MNNTSLLCVNSNTCRPYYLVSHIQEIVGIIFLGVITGIGIVHTPIHQVKYKQKIVSISTEQKTAVA